MPSAILMSKGQITIPKEIRDELRVREGDKIEFSKTPEGTIVVRPQRVEFEAVAGILKRPGRRAPTASEKDAAIGSFLTSKHARASKRQP